MEFLILVENIRVLSTNILLESKSISYYNIYTAARWYPNRGGGDDDGGGRDKGRWLVAAVPIICDVQQCCSRIVTTAATVILYYDVITVRWRRGKSSAKEGRVTSIFGPHRQDGAKKIKNNNKIMFSSHSRSACVSVHTRDSHAPS